MGNKIQFPEDAKHHQQMTIQNALMDTMELMVQAPILMEIIVVHIFRYLIFHSKNCFFFQSILKMLRQLNKVKFQLIELLLPFLQNQNQKVKKSTTLLQHLPIYIKTIIKHTSLSINFVSFIQFIVLFLLSPLYIFQVKDKHLDLE